jgi:hypothetical protein
MIRKAGTQNFQDELTAIAAQELRAGRIGRLDFVWLTSALGATPSLAGLAPRFMAAKTKEIAARNFDGEPIKPDDGIWCDAFAADTGIEFDIRSQQAAARQDRALVNQELAARLFLTSRRKQLSI